MHALLAVAAPAGSQYGWQEFEPPPCTPTQVVPGTHGLPKLMQVSSCALEPASWQFVVSTP
jgi:hypothetical protein